MLRSFFTGRWGLEDSRAMDDATNPITRGEGFGDFAANLLHDACVVASHACASGVTAPLKVNRLPIRRVEGDSRRFDEDVVVAQAGKRYGGDGRLAFAFDDHGFHLDRSRHI